MSGNAPTTGLIRRSDALRTCALAGASAILLFVLHAFGLLPLNKIGAAFRYQRPLLALDVACVVVAIALGIVRHAWALSVIGVKVPLGRVAGANLIGQGLGQWLPGSMAVAEGLRIGLLLGRRPGVAARQGDFVKIAMASIGDRLIGLGVMFLIGGAATVSLALSRPQTSVLLLAMIAAGSVAIGGALLSLPLFGDNVAIRAFAAMLGDRSGETLLERLAVRFAAGLRHVSEASARWRRHRGGIFVAALLSGVVCVINPLTMFLASVAIGGGTPLLVMMAALPITIISIVLPTGFAGFGGPQLIFVAIFALFGVPLETVMAMTLLQNALLLTVQTVLALAWVVLRQGDLAAAFSPKGA